MPTSKMIPLVAAGLLSATLLPATVAAKKERSGPVVIAPGSEIAGADYGEWPAWLLKAYLETPADAGDPLDMCAAQPQDVVFLPPALGLDAVTWTCSITPETVVILTLRDTWSAGLPTDPEEETAPGYLRRVAKCLDQKSKIKATLNAKNVPRSNFLFVGADGGMGEDLVNVRLPVGTVPVAVKGHYLAITGFPPGQHLVSVQSEGCSGTGLDDQDLVVNVMSAVSD